MEFNWFESKGLRKHFYVKEFNYVRSTQLLGRVFLSTRVLESATELRISPNPASEFVILKSNKSMINSDITIENEIGQKFELKLLSSSENEIVIDVSQLLPGIYYIYLNPGSTQRVEKLIIQ